MDLGNHLESIYCSCVFNINDFEIIVYLVHKCQLIGKVSEIPKRRKTISSSTLLGLRNKLTWDRYNRRKSMFDYMQRPTEIFNPKEMTKETVFILFREMLQDLTD